MGKSLVIVESPAKAKTINKYLGKDYVVKSSVGHVRDLPTSGSASTEPKTCHSRHQAQRIREGGQGSQRPVLRMGINPTAGWQANYQILPGKEKWSASCKVWPPRPTPSISQPTWIERGSDRLAPARDHRWRRQPLQARGVQRDHQERHPGGVRPAVRVEHSSRQRPAGPSFPSTGWWATWSPALVEEAGPRPLRRSGKSVAVRPIVDKERAIKAFVPVGVLGSQRRPAHRPRRASCAWRWSAATEPTSSR